MKATGVVRPIDNLGRIVLPIELRRIMNLNEKDLLEIRPNPDNKKFKNLFLTEKAKSLQDKASAYREYTESVVIKDFTPDEKEYFEKTLFKVFHNLLNDSSLSQEEKDLIERRFMEND